MISLSIKYHRLTDSYDVCRFVKSQLVFVNDNLFAVFKIVLPTDRVSYLKIQLSSVNGMKTMDASHIQLSSNIITIISQFNFVIPTHFVLILVFSQA